MEWLDIVDHNDNVIGRDTRDNIHAQQLKHRSTHIVLRNSQGQVFVQLRSLSKQHGAGLWDTSAAGHVDSGESYKQCAVRELSEELGIKIDESQLASIAQLQPQACTGFEFTHVFGVVSDQALVLQTEEIDDGKWLSAAELDTWMLKQPEAFTEVFKIIWPMASELPPIR